MCTCLVLRLWRRRCLELLECCGDKADNDRNASGDAKVFECLEHPITSSPEDCPEPRVDSQYYFLSATTSTSG